MSVVLIDLLFLILASMSGALVVWFFGIHNRAPLVPPPTTDTDSRKAANALSQLHEVATRMTLDLGAHNDRVEEINADLKSFSDPEITNVVDLVAKLVQANEQVQDRLATAESRLQEQAQQLESTAIESRTDALTMLSNRRAFDKDMACRLAEFKRHKRTFSLVMVDVDHFKKFNDMHGHQAGDHVLQGVARTLRRRTREMDLVARYGGEEFAFILPGTSLQDAAQAAKHVREGIEQAHFQFEGKVLQVTASLGIAQVFWGEDAAGLIGRADMALYAAKEAGRNCVHWHDGKGIFPIDTNIQEQISENKSETLSVEPAMVREYEAEPSKGDAADKSPATPVSPPVEDDSEPCFVPEGGAEWNLLSRPAFLQQARVQMDEWERSGLPFCIFLIKVEPYDASHADAQAHDLGVEFVARRAVASLLAQRNAVGRYSHDCIAILLPQIQLTKGISLAEHLQHNISENNILREDSQLRVTVSIGVVEVSERDDCISLLRRAETTLEAAIQDGGNCTYFHKDENCWSCRSLRELAGHST